MHASASPTRSHPHRPPPTLYRAHAPNTHPSTRLSTVSRSMSSVENRVAPALPSFSTCRDKNKKRGTPATPSGLVPCTAAAVAEARARPGGKQLADVIRSYGLFDELLRAFCTSVKVTLLVVEYRTCASRPRPLSQVGQASPRPGSVLLACLFFTHAFSLTGFLGAIIDGTTTKFASMRLALLGQSRSC